MSKFLSIVLPTLNRETFALSTLQDLLAQNYSPFEVLVVDQSEIPSAKIQELARANSDKVTYFHVQFRGLPIARNFGWQKSRGQIVLYIDDDIRCGPNLAEEHVKSMHDDRVGVVAGGIDEANRDEEKNPKQVGTFSFWTATPKRGFQSQVDQDVQHAPGGNFSVRRELFKKVGGFDELFSKGAALYEETDFCLRVLGAKRRIVFNPQARILHLAASTGGCRVPQLTPYLRSLSRNRTMIIRRYLAWYQKPIAFARLFVLNLSYIYHQRQPMALVSGLAGLIEGYRSGSKSPLMTSFE